MEIIQLLINYGNENNIVLNINDKNDFNDFPLMYSVQKNDFEIVNLLINYANEHNITLNINDKITYGSYPLLEAIDNNSFEMVKLLFNYAFIKKIDLIINDKRNSGEYPLQLASKNNNIEIANLLIRYAFDNNIKLKYNINDLSSEIMGILKGKEKDKNIIDKFIPLVSIISHSKKLFGSKKSDKVKNKNKRNNNKSNTLLNSPNLVIATKDFTAEEYDQIDIKKGEFLIVTGWNYKDGWVYGHRKDHPEEKGLFPKIFIKKCNDRNKENSTFKFEITPEYRIQFEKKIIQLRNESDMQNNSSNFIMTIDRNHLLKNSFESIMNHSPTEMKGRMKILYKNENGYDVGGLLRDFFYQVSKEIGNPNNSFFKYSNDNSYELEINPKSCNISDYLKYYQFFGRILGLAIFHKQYLSINFNLLFYKRLLNKPLEISDLEYIDPELYKNIKWLKENNGVENLYLTFELDTVDSNGHHKKVELKRNGSKIDVTDSNKNEYINLVIKHKLNNTNDKKQFEALKRGFYEIVTKNIDSIINEFDLKFLISGVNEINVDDWENNTEYDGYSKYDITIINFWKCVRDLSTEKQEKLLLFATGNSQVPVTGFKDLIGNGQVQHFRLKRAGSLNDLPISHTCFNRIDLPPYTSYTVLKQKILHAISEGIGGFNLE